MTALTHAITSALLHFIWQAPLVALLLFFTLTMLQRASAQLRYVLSCAALAVMAVLPLVTVAILYRAAIPITAPVLPFEPAPPTGTGTFAIAPLSAWIALLENWALPVWFAGVLIFAVRLIWMARHVVKLQRTGTAPEDSLIRIVSRLAGRMNIGRPVRVLISTLTDAPSVAGWLRPVILLPSATLLNLTADQLEAVLAHELAHIRRHDYLVNILQVLVETLFFYQPAVWWASSRIRRERELCCDDMVVSLCGNPVGYARALTKLERLRVFAPELTLSSAAVPLLYRIRRLTGVAQEQPPSKASAVIALVLALTCLLINVRWAHAQPQTGREASISRDAIWVDTVKYGDLPIMVRALGTVRNANTAELSIPAPQCRELQPGQAASLQFRRGISVAGKVARADSCPDTGSATVAVELQSPVPELVGEPVDGIIQIRTMKDLIYVGRPASSTPNAGLTLFKLEPDGAHARRVKVRFGAAAVDKVQVLEGLQPGDRVILSDTTKYDGYDRLRLE